MSSTLVTLVNNIILYNPNLQPTCSKQSLCCILILELLNTFRKMLDLSEVTWNDIQVPMAEGGVLSDNTKQTSISNFLK
jgi:hypothetical protein